MSASSTADQPSQVVPSVPWLHSNGCFNPSAVYQLPTQPVGITPYVIRGHTRAVTSVKWNIEGDMLICASKTGFVTIHRADGLLFQKCQGSAAAIADVDINAASTLLATAGSDYFTRLWDVPSGNVLANITHEAPVLTVAFSHGDQYLLVLTDNKMGQRSKLAVYELPALLRVSNVEELEESFKEPVVTYESADRIMHAAWGPTNDRIYMSTNNGDLIIWDKNTQKEVLSKSIHDDECRRFNFDRDYVTLVTASRDTTAALLDARTLRVLARYETDMPVNGSSLSPIADHVLLGGGIEAQEVTTSSGGSTFPVLFHHKLHQHLLGQINCHFGTITTVDFHPSGRGFASGGADGIIKIHCFDDLYLTGASGINPGWSPF